jgi:2-amino-4-hydroxy-6-hydroxymethyldihydropteridine diphosphokinase
VAIGLGSNLGDRLGSLEFGARHLETLVSDLRISSVYDSEPVGIVEQPRFLNACCTGRCVLAAPDLLARLKAIERDAGRSPHEPRFGPRVLDLDILLYGREIVDTETLTVPHPRLDRRAFALVPLSEIAADWVHPGRGVTIGALSREFGTEGVTRTAWTLDPGGRTRRRAGSGGREEDATHD